MSYSSIDPWDLRATSEKKNGGIERQLIFTSIGTKGYTSLYSHDAF